MPVLEPPGSGLPAFERFYLNLFLKIGCYVTSDDAALNSFQTSSQDILKTVANNDIGVLSQQILLPRMQGIEDFRFRTEEIGDESGRVRTFVGYDVEGYFLEWDTFLDVEGNEALVALLRR